MTDVYNLVIYHNYLGALVMDVRTEHGVTRPTCETTR